jgi:hypothetical protein
MGPTKEGHRILCKSRKKCNGELGNMIRQAAGEKVRTIQGCLNGMLGSGQTEKVETGKDQSQEHAHHFL